jgi:decaprenylphospho-beta-D-erythro-pentofuranosid-2-ulose 2-reductase
MRNALGGVQSVLVLGGGSDIAAATLRKLVADRCRTVVLAVRDPSSVADLVTELEAAGASKVETIAFDARDTASHGAVIAEAFSSHGDIDLVFSAFGVLGDQDTFDSDPAGAADAVVVNFAGQVSALTACASAMKAQGHGLIVVMSSVAGERVRKDNAVYGATKAGLDGFAQGLSDRLVGSGVKVMVVRPGFVHSKMTDGMEAAPFSTTPEAVADDIVTGITKGSAIVWSPGVLRWVFTIMRHLPRPIWRIVSNR